MGIIGSHDDLSSGQQEEQAERVVTEESLPRKNPFKDSSSRRAEAEFG
jgi:hypothetical protein